MRSIRVVVWMLVWLALAVPGRAQVTTGSIVGTVSDPQGQVIPGASVTIRETGKQTGTTTTTDENGAYNAPFLVPGTYEVEVELSGFRKCVRQGIAVQVSSRTRVDATLEVGQLTETTTVVAAVPLVQTESSEVGTVIGETAIRELPLERAQFRDAGLPRARRHPGSGRREPLGCEHVQPTRGVELQRARPAGEHQRLAHRRHRQQRVHLQHRHRRPVGGVGARVQGPQRCVLGRVRPRRRRRLGLDQVGQQRPPWHRFRLHPQRRLRRPQLLRAAGPRRRQRGAEAAPPPPPVRRRDWRTAGHPRPVQRHQPHVLLCRLLRAEGDAWPVVRQHRADGGDPQRRLQRLPQPDDGCAHPRLRSADDAPQPELQPGCAGERDRTRSSCGTSSRATSSRRTASIRWAATSRASTRSRTSRAASTTT